MLEGIKSETALCSPRLLRQINVAKATEGRVSIIKSNPEPTPSPELILLHEAISYINLEESRAGHIPPHIMNAREIMRKLADKL